MSDATLRRARTADADALVALHERALRDAGTDPAAVPGTGDLRDVDEAYHEAGGTFYVIADDAPRGGRLLAMGGCKPVDDATVELLRIAVRPGRQREGFGSRIVDELEAFARREGYERAALETARRQAAATDFYPARGYEETGRRRDGEYELVRFEKAL